MLQVLYSFVMLNIISFVSLMCLSIMMSAYQAVSLFIFGLAMMLFFRIRLNNRSKYFYLVFVACTTVFDAYQNIIIGTTFFTATLAFDMFTLFLTIVNNPNYIATYPVKSFSVFMISFTTISVLLINFVSKGSISLFLTIINLLVLITLYWYVCHREKVLKFKYSYTKSTIY